jgi:hypothetical protein
LPARASGHKRGVQAAARAVVVALAIALAGCVGPIKRDELERGVQTIGATAAEGALLARGAAQDRTRSTFTRVHARELGASATHEAERLNDAGAEGAVAGVKADAVRLAQNVAGALGELEVAPGDERLAGRLAQRLDAFSSVAARLAGEL